MGEVMPLSVFVSKDGRSFGVGDPEANDPKEAEHCLLCGVTEQVITLADWRDILMETDRNGETLEIACNRMIEKFGGRVILRPSRIHLINEDERGLDFVVKPVNGEYEA